VPVGTVSGTSSAEPELVTVTEPLSRCGHLTTARRSTSALVRQDAADLALGQLQYGRGTGVVLLSEVALVVGQQRVETE